MRGRRQLACAVAAIAVLVLVTGAATLERPRLDVVGPYADGVGLAPDGTPVLLRPGQGGSHLPGSRVVVPADDATAQDVRDADLLAEQQQTWLASGTIPGTEDGYGEMVAGALLDMAVLTGEHGGTVAALNANWRYVWPRDTSFVAAAFAATGHADEAIGNLEFLQRVQGADGSFEARYLPDGTGTPDDRLPQTDGTGWALWSLDRVLEATERDGSVDTVALAEQLAPLLDRGTAFLLAQVDNPRSLPAPSSDYWEHRERRLTLGTAAPVLAGLEAATRTHARLGQDDRAAETAEAADRLRTAIESAFGAHGYGRYPGRSHADSASAFVLPPLQPEPLAGAEQAWRDSVPLMMRPGGGIAPGAGWKEASLSWTPETALYAWAAAGLGDDETARDWLDWIQEHRTPLGAIPEKVGPDGAPAGPAPLAWTSALVVLTAVELDRD